MISNWFDLYFLLFKDYSNKSGTKENTYQTGLKSFDLKFILNYNIYTYIYILILP